MYFISIAIKKLFAILQKDSLLKLCNVFPSTWIIKQKAGTRNNTKTLLINTLGIFHSFALNNSRNFARKFLIILDTCSLGEAREILG